MERERTEQHDRTEQIEPKGEAEATGVPAEAPERPARGRLGLGWAAMVGGIALALLVFLVVWLLV